MRRIDAGIAPRSSDGPEPGGESGRDDRAARTAARRLPFLLAPPFLRYTGLAALVALVLELLFLPRLVTLDSAVWQAILFWRGCGTDQAVDRVVGMATGAAIVLLGAAALVSARGNGPRATWPPLAVSAVGLYASRVLKEAFARERPSMIPGVALGHSFPSGHVMNAALAALAVAVLAAGFRHPRRWWAAATFLLVAVFAGRLLIADHWFLDAVGSVLAALAMTGLCLPPFCRRQLLAPSVVAVALTAVLVIDAHVPSLKIRLPSPLSLRESVTAHFGISESTDAPDALVLQGGWEKQVERFPRLHAWLRGAGTIEIVLQATGAGRLLKDGRPVATLIIAGRPDDALSQCVRLAIAVNGRALPAFVAFAGWREYRLPVPAATLRSGANEVQIEVRDRGGGPARFAVEYLRIDFRRGASGEGELWPSL